MSTSTPALSHRARRLGSATVVLLALAFALGCSQASRDRARFDSGLPGMTTPMRVVSVHARGPYLQAVLDFAGNDAEGWALPTEACEAVFEAGAEIEYRDDGPQGTWRRGELACQSYGFGPMTLWRDRKSRATPAGIPRAQANYRVIHQDEDTALLRGIFALATLVGFERGDDIVAVVSPGGACDKPIASGVASMEYRGKGRNPLSLVGSTGLCSVRALLLPPGELESKALEEASETGSGE